MMPAIISVMDKISFNENVNMPTLPALSATGTEVRITTPDAAKDDGPSTNDDHEMNTPSARSASMVNFEMAPSPGWVEMPHINPPGTWTCICRAEVLESKKKCDSCHAWFSRKRGKNRREFKRKLEMLADGTPVTPVVAPLMSQVSPPPNTISQTLMSSITTAVWSDSGLSLGNVDDGYEVEREDVIMTFAANDSAETRDSGDLDIEGAGFQNFQ